jgi:Ni/Co efflux regulator RcnB
MNTSLKWGAALMLAIATAATAAPAAARDDRGRHGYSQRDYDRHDRRHDRRDHRQDRRYDRRDNRYDRRHDYAHSRHYSPPPRVVHHRSGPPVRVVHHRPVVHHVYHPAPRRHVGPPPWARGGYVHHYNRPIHVVHDYRGYGLRHPPRGHRWVRDDYGHYLLVAIATGVIVDLILRG